MWRAGAGLRGGCRAVEITSANNFAYGASIGVMPTPQGHIRKRGSSYEIVVPAGRDPVTGRYRYAYEKAASLEAAKKVRDEMLERIADGRDPATRATVGELLDRWLALAELECGDGLEDLVSGLGPGERPGVLVPLIGPLAGTVISA
jgi:hypothetical protein